MTLSFEIPGDPRGKGRPKFARRGAFVQTYTDDRTAAYENLVALAAKSAMSTCTPPIDRFEGPVALCLTATFGIPKSASKKARAAMLAGDQKHTKLPDLDNVLKAVLDGCNQIVFRDDSQVVGIVAHKQYGDAPRVLVTITPFGAQA